MDLKNILKKLSGSAQRSELTIEEKIQQLLRDTANKTKDNKQMQATLILADIIIPAVLNKTQGGFDKIKCRDWAFACAKMIGFLAGVSVQRAKQHKAIDRISNEAKNFVSLFSTFSPEDNTKSISANRDETSMPNKDLSPPTSPALKADVSNYKRKIIEDLEAEAMLAIDTNVKEALTLQVSRMRKTLELEEDKK